MLADSPVSPTIPITNLSDSRDFYENKLGLKVVDESMPDGVLFEAGNGTTIFIYQRPVSKAEHTLANFMVTDLEGVMEELSARGVKFEHYDMPGLKTNEKGVASMGPIQSAWFKDPDGNILGITQID